VFITTEQHRKKKGEKPLHLDDFSVLLLTFFQLNYYSWGEPVVGDISAHRLIFSLLPMPPNRVYYNRVAMQKER
jgi:hypothetical protein